MVDKSPIMVAYVRCYLDLRIVVGMGYGDIVQDEWLSNKNPIILLSERNIKKSTSFVIKGRECSYRKRKEQ